MWHHSLAGVCFQTEEFTLLAMFSDEGWLCLMLEAGVDPLQMLSQSLLAKTLVYQVLLSIGLKC